MINSINVSLSRAQLALSCGEVVDFGIGEDTGLTDEGLTNNLLLSQALLAFFTLGIEYLIDVADHADLLSQVIQTALGTVETYLLLIPNERSVLWTAGEVVGGGSLEGLDLVFALTDGAIVPIEHYQVILEIAAIQIHQSTDLFVYYYITKVPIQGLIDESEVLFREAQQLINIRGDEAAISAGGFVGSQLRLLFLGVGDIAIDLRAVEGGYPGTDLILGADGETELQERAMQRCEARGDFFALLDDEAVFIGVVEVGRPRNVVHLVRYLRKLLLELNLLYLVVSGRLQVRLGGGKAKGGFVLVAADG